MDLPTFLIETFRAIGTVLSAWAWPAALIAVAVIFKRELCALLARVQSFKAFGVETAFGKALSDLEGITRESGSHAPEQVGGPERHGTEVERRSDAEGSAVQDRSDRPEARSSSTLDIGPTSGPKPSSRAARDQSVWQTLGIDENREAALRRKRAMTVLNSAWAGVERSVRNLSRLVADSNAGVHSRVFLGSMLQNLLDRGIVSNDLKFRIDELQRLLRIAELGVTELSLDSAARYFHQAQLARDEIDHIASAYTDKPAKPAQ